MREDDKLLYRHTVSMRCRRKDMIEIDKRYRNLHTGIVCVVVSKAFFNIAYLEDGDPSNAYPHYCHYKTFQKKWVEVTDDEL